MSLENLNFDVILHDEDFNKKVKADIAEAERLNTTLSTLLEVKGRVSQRHEISVDTKKAENSLEKLNEWYRQLEQAEWSKIGKDLNIEPYVAQAIARLKELEKELNTIQELRKMEGGSGDFYLAEEYKKTSAAAQGVLNSINALREAQKNLGVDSNSTFREFIDSLTRSDFQLQQMAAHYREMEKSPAKAAAEWKKMEAEYEKTYGTAKQVTAETQKTAAANKDWEAAQKRIQENLAKEASQQSQAASNEALRQKSVAAVVESQNQLNRLIEQGTAAQEKHNSRVREMNANLVNTQSIWRTISQLTGVYFGAAGMRRFVSSLIEVTGNLEMQREAMSHILGNANKGAVIFEQLKELAKPSYFTLPDLTKYAKQLSALSIPYEELFETTKMLGDVSAGLGVSFDRIALAYGHIRSMGFLRGMQARQLTNAGIPIFEELAKNLSKTEEKLVSISDVYDRMAKRQITFAQVKEVFEQMTSEGGKFYDMQIAMTDTLAGRVNKLKGVWQIALSEMGEANSGVLKGSVNALIKMVEHLDAIGAALKPVIIGLGTYGAALALVATYQSAVTAINNIRYFIEFARTENIATAATVAFGSATKAAAGALGILVMAGFGIYEIVKAVRNANNESQAFGKAIKAANDNIVAERTELDKLADVARDTTKAMSERTDAVNTINDKYGEYLRNLGLEKVSVDNLADSYEALRGAIANKYLEELREQAVGTKRTELNNARSGIMDFNAKFLNNRQITVNGKTGKAGSGAIGLIQREIEDFIDAHPLYGQQELANAIANIYARHGVKVEDIKANGNKIYAAVDDYVRANKALQKAEKDFNNFAAGYNQPRNAAANAPKQDFWKIFDTELSKVTDADLQKRLGRLFGYGDEHDWETYREKLGKEYDRVSKELEGAFNDERRKPLQQELNFLKRLDNAYGGHLLSGNKTKKREGNAENKEKNAQIAEIKAQIANLQKLREQYESLVNNPLVGPDNAPALMTQFHGVTKFDFSKQVRDLTDELLKLNPELDEYAQGVLQAFGKDALADYLSSLSAFDSLDDKIQAYLDKDFTLNGEKTTAKVSKAVTDLFNKNIKVDVSAGAMIKDLEKAEAKIKTDYMIANKDKWEKEGISESDQAALADAYWKEWKKNRAAEIKAQAQQEKSFNTKNTRETIRGFADDLFKEQMQGFDMTNWSDKTLSQIKAIENALKKVKVPEDVLLLLGEGSADAKALIAELQRLVTETQNNTVNPEKWKAIEKRAKKIAGYFSQAGEMLQSLASATGNTTLSAVAEGVSAVAQNLTAAAEGAVAWGGWWGAIIGGVTDIFQQIVDGVVEAETKAEEFKNTLAEIALNFRTMWHENQLKEGVDTPFGDNLWKKATNAMTDYNAALSQTQKLTKQAVDDWNKDTYYSRMQEFLNREAAKGYNPRWESSGSDGLQISTGVDIPAINSSDFTSVMAAAQQYANDFAHRQDIGDVAVRTYAPGWWKRLWGSTDQYTSLKDIYNDLIQRDEFKDLQMYTEDGFLNPAFVDAVRKAYAGELTSDDNNWLNQVYEEADAAQKAMQQFDEVVKELFGDLASSLTDQFIDNFFKMGNAVDDLGATFESLGETILKSILQSFVLDEILSKYKKQVQEMTKKYATGEISATELAEQIGDFADAVKDDIASESDVINGIISAFYEKGILANPYADESTDGQSLGEGIKGITEETASLLASYINAVRADVSFIRSLQATGWQNVAEILERISTPTLNEYLAQCAANTYDMAQSNRQILSEIQSVIAPVGASSGQVVKVELA